MKAGGFFGPVIAIPTCEFEKWDLIDEYHNVSCFIFFLSDDIFTHSQNLIIHNYD